MSYSIEFKQVGHCLYAKASGERNPESVYALTKKLLEESVNTNLDYVFFDIIDLSGRLKIRESLSVVTYIFPKLGYFEKLKKLALLDSIDRYERSRFIERAAKARGYNFRIFEDQIEAEEWIQHRNN